MAEPCLHPHGRARMSRPITPVRSLLSWEYIRAQQNPKIQEGGKANSPPAFEQRWQHAIEGVHFKWTSPNTAFCPAQAGDVVRTCGERPNGSNTQEQVLVDCNTVGDGRVVQRVLLGELRVCRPPVPPSAVCPGGPRQNDVRVGGVPQRGDASTGSSRFPSVQPPRRSGM